MRRVRVEFVDVESGQTVESATLPVERVPNPMELKPQLRLGEQRWVVIRAEPAGSDEVTASGHLRLTVRRVEELTTANLRYEAPTLSAHLPDLGEPDFPEALAHEAAEPWALARSEWRQVEFVSRNHAERLAQDLQAVRRVLSSTTAETYPDLHVRRELHPSATPPIGLEWLFELMRWPSLQPLRLGGLHTVQDGFAIRSASGLVLYGVAPRARVQALGLSVPGCGLQPDALYHDLRALSELGEVHGLVLMDWRQARAYPPSRFANAL